MYFKLYLKQSEKCLFLLSDTLAGKKINGLENNI